MSRYIIFCPFPILFHECWWDKKKRFSQIIELEMWGKYLQSYLKQTKNEITYLWERIANKGKIRNEQFSMEILHRKGKQIDISMRRTPVNGCEVFHFPTRGWREVWISSSRDGFKESNLQFWLSRFGTLEAMTNERVSQLSEWIFLE